MSLQTKNKLTFSYNSGIAPLVTAKEYADLIANYKKTGNFPHILKLGGMAIDASMNRNQWMLPKEELDGVASQLNGAPIMKNHDIDHVESIIGKVHKAWREGDKVMYEGEIADEELIQKILLGYVKYNSIQIGIPAAYCYNCEINLGKKDEEASIDNMEAPCPRCGDNRLLIRKPVALEQSIVAIPAYENADIYPIGFKASLSAALGKRFTSKDIPKKASVAPKPTPKPSPDITPLVVKSYTTVTEFATLAAQMFTKLAQMELEEVPVDVFEPDQPCERHGIVGCDICGELEIEAEGEDALAHYYGEEAKGGKLKDFPLVEKKGEADECTCDPNDPTDLCPSCSALAQSLGMMDTYEKPEEARPETRLKHIADKLGVSIEELQQNFTSEELTELDKTEEIGEDDDVE